MNHKFGLIWQDILNLESELEDILAYIPYTENNYDIFSPKCSNLIVAVCSKLESFLKYSLQSSLFNYTQLFGFQHLNKSLTSLKNKSKPTIKDYESLYNPLYHLNDKIVIFKTHNFLKLLPFQTWNEKNLPPWWDRYNKLKHNYYGEIESGTLNKAVYSLAGYFLVFVNHIESLNWMLHHTNAIKCDKPKNLLFKELKTPEEILEDWDLKKDYHSSLLNKNTDNKYIRYDFEEYNDDVKRNVSLFENIKEWWRLFQPFNIPIRMIAESNFFIYLYESPLTYEYYEYLRNEENIEIDIQYIRKNLITNQ